MLIECLAHLKQYSVKALQSLDKSLELRIIVTEQEPRLQEIIKELAIIKADELVSLKIEK